MNSKRSPFQVKRYGHDDGLRSSSVNASCRAARPPGSGAGAPAWRRQRRRRRAAGGSSACTMPAGHSTRTTSADGARAEAEHEVARRGGRPRARRLELLAQAAGAQLHLRADRAAVADAARQPDAQRRLPAAAVVLQQRSAGRARRRRSRAHEVGVAVAVDVAGREPRRARSPDGTSRRRPAAGASERAAAHRPAGTRAPAGPVLPPLRSLQQPARRRRRRRRAGRRCRDRRTARR